MSDAIMPFYTDKVNPFLHWMMFSLPPGPYLGPICHTVNVMKGGTLPFILALMRRYDNYSFSAYLIAALHGSYGLLWCLKHVVLPDAFWHTKAKLLSHINAVILLALYWAPSYLIISRRVNTRPPRAFAAIMLYVFGVVAMMASDTQKYFVLKERKGLIKDGWFGTCRNTNYLGEMMLYSSFAVLSESWIPWFIYGSVWSSIFASRWAAKDASFKKKVGGPEYIASSSIILPFPLSKGKVQ